MVLLLVFAATVGHGITGRWAGVLIDERNKMSLSRLQMVMWTILVLAAFLTASLSNIVLDPLGSPLAIAIPTELLLAMGISTSTLIGSPLILSAKTGNPNEDEKAQTIQILASRGVEANRLGNEGLVVTKSAPKDAQVSDLFNGEETGNAAQLDLGKIQMLYVTIVLLFAYGAAIGTTFASHAGIVTALPRVDASMIALLGLSHAGYLTYKAVPHSKTQQDTSVTLSPDVQAQRAAARASQATPAQTLPQDQAVVAAPIPGNQGN
jgi:hypothetical protein